MQSRSYPWRYSAFIMAYYVTNAVYQGYIPKYYRSIGMTDAQLSVLMAAMPIVSIFAQPAWGALGDRFRSRNAVLRIMIALSCASVALYMAGNSIWYLLPLSCLFAACYTPIQPMGDSIVLESLHQSRQPFGPLRLTGCLAFAFMNLAFGFLLNDRQWLTTGLTAGLLVVCFASTYALPPTKGHQSRGAKMNITMLLKHKRLMGLMAFLMLLQLTLGFYYSYFPIYFTEDVPGGTTALLGVCFFISATSEVPFLLNADKLFDRLGAGRLMSISALVTTLRWIVLATSDNVYLIMGSQVLHGWGFIVMTVSMSKYVSITVPDELKASGQMLLAVVGFGIARAFGILGGGLLADAMGGTRPGFLLMSVVSGLTLIAFAPIYLRRPPMNGYEQEPRA